MPTFNDPNTCNPIITFFPEDVGKTFKVTQTVTDPYGETDTFEKNILVSTSITVVCEDEELTIPATDSYISNPDFNSYSELPNFAGQMSRANSWGQFSKGTSDYFHPDGYTNGSGGVTTASPDGGGYVGFISNSHKTSTGYEEYVGQNLTTPIPSGSTILSNFYAGGGNIVGEDRYATTGDRRVVLYGIPNVVAMPIDTWDSIYNMGLGVVKLGEFVLSVTGSDWEIGSIEFTAPFDIKCLVFGGESTDPNVAGDRNPKYTCVDGLLVAEKSKFACP
ncbi:hypothetical protein N9043_00750 [bacterium]|nr:hypothetical protein [bacterium]